MATVTAFEAKTRFGKLLKRVVKGEEIVITRHEKPVARLVPEGRKSNEAVRKAVAGLRALQAEIQARTRGQKPLRYADIKSAIEEGRK
jgi:prevent-host-death family protein